LLHPVARRHQDISGIKTSNDIIGRVLDIRAREGIRRWSD